MRLFQASEYDVCRIEKCARMCCTEHGEEACGGPLDWEHYRDTWIVMIRQGIAAMFLVEDADGQIVGGIGGAKYPALLTGKLRASQQFIYVQPAYRGRISIRRLVTEFEVWAVENGCHDVLMPLINTMPPKTKGFYEQRGYKVLETLYHKELEAKS